MTHINILATSEIGPDFISKMIMKKLKTNFSHVLIYFDGLIIHSVGDGLVILEHRESQKYLETHEVKEKFNVALNCSEDYFYGYVRGAQGKEYSSSQYIGFLVPFLAKFFANKKEKLICSEFVAEVLNECCGFNLKDLDFLSPKDIVEFLKKEKAQGRVR